MLTACIYHLVHFGFKTLVELFHPFVPLGIALCDIIEFLLHIGSKIVVHDVGEVLHQEVVDHDADICRQQFAFL